GQVEFGEAAGGKVEAPDRAIGLVAEPDVPIGTGRNADADAKKGKLIFGDDAGRRDGGNLAGRTFSEPDVAIRAERDIGRIAQGWGHKVTDAAVGSNLGNLIAIGKREP